jgi:hypothetical protein
VLYWRLELTDVRVCTKCRVERRIDEFRFRHTEGRPNHWCKLCERDYDKQRRDRMRSLRTDSPKVSHVVRRSLTGCLPLDLWQHQIYTDETRSETELRLAANGAMFDKWIADNPQDMC